MTQAFDHKAANLWVSRVIPLVLIGIVGYVSWVVIARLCVDYLLQPQEDFAGRRQGAAIAICVLYGLLVLLIAITYFRLLYVVTANPGYVPQGPRLRERRSHRRKITSQRKKGGGFRDEEDAVGSARDREKREGGTPGGGPYANGTSGAPISIEAAPGLHDFYTKDVFVCQGDGRPIWCTKCENWKPDRAHHCREIERCVRKMDHFCPCLLGESRSVHEQKQLSCRNASAEKQPNEAILIVNRVGGVVSETSFKFFIQFVAWTALYCVFNLIITAYFLSEQRRETHSFDVHLLVTLCLGALFGLFTMGMTGSSLQFVFLNTTTIENLSRKSIVWTLAIYMPKLPDSTPAFRTISYSNTQASSNRRSPTEQNPNDTIRTFAILHTKPGENPFDLGPYGNFKSVMGDHWYDWLFPIRYSPCCDHDREEGRFVLGPVVQRMRKEAGIPAPHRTYEEKVVRRRRRRRRRRHKDDAYDGRGEIMREKRTSSRRRQHTHTRHDRDDIDLESGIAEPDGR
ncbi:Palmitoyltransferase pfa5 [Lecanora helva]